MAPGLFPSELPQHSAASNRRVPLAFGATADGVSGRFRNISGRLSLSLVVIGKAAGKVISWIAKEHDVFTINI